METEEGMRKPDRREENEMRSMKSETESRGDCDANGSHRWGEAKAFGTLGGGGDMLKVGPGAAAGERLTWSAGTPRQPWVARER